MIAAVVARGFGLVIGKSVCCFMSSPGASSWNWTSTLLINKMLDVEIILQMICKLPFYLSALIV